jgi:ubiquitin conjugation factor E4 B
MVLDFFRDDLEYVAVIASLPAQQTVFEYLVGCWKRLNSARGTLIKKVKYILPDYDLNTMLTHTVDLGISACGNSTSARCTGEAT